MQKNASLALKFVFLCTALLIVVLLASSCPLPDGLKPAPDDTPVPNAPPWDGTPWVMAYHPVYQWEDLTDPVNGIPWGNLTHLLAGYLIPGQSEGKHTLVLPPGLIEVDKPEFIEKLRKFSIAAHSNGCQLIIHIGGEGSNNSGQWTVATSPANISAFAKNIVSIARDGCWADGVDLNWEGDNPPVNFEQLRNLVKKIRKLWPESIITLPTGPTGEDAMQLAGVKEYVDAFMPMTYIDQRVGWAAFSPVPLTPLYDEGSMYSVEKALDRWLAAGVSADKIVMGIGGFGSFWGDGNGDGYGPIAPYTNRIWDSPAYGEYASLSGMDTFYQKDLEAILSANPTAWTKAWDDVGKCSYWHVSGTDALVDYIWYGTTKKVSLLFYESSESIDAKREYISEKNLHGMMFWTLAELKDHNGNYPILEAAKPAAP